MDAEADELAELLLRWWDPLLVDYDDGDPGAESEYRFEAGEILELLRAGATEWEIAAFLRTRGAELGPINLPRDGRAASKVMSWYLRPAAPPSSPDEAARLAIAFIKAAHGPTDWEPAAVEIEDIGTFWRISYNSAEFIRTGEVRHALAGNQPLLVDKQTGETSMEDAHDGQSR